MKPVACRSYLNRGLLPLALSKRARGFLALTLILGVTGCGSPAMNESSRPAHSSAEPKGSVALNKTELRAWINSVALNPPFPHKDQTLTASTDWGPQGRTDISVFYRWYVNEVEIQKEPSHELVLKEFHPGDRIYVVSELRWEDGSMVASERSRSVVVQNRPPELTSGLE